MRKISKPELPDYFLLAQSYNGLKELPGKKNNNKQILQFFADCGHSWVQNDETAWCAAFVGSNCKQKGYELPPIKERLRARGYLQWGIKVPEDEAQVGDIVIISRGSNPKQGHIGYNMGSDDKYIYIYGGNQNNKVNTKRFAKSRLLGYRRPPPKVPAVLTKPKPMPVKETVKNLRKAGSRSIANNDQVAGAGKAIVLTGGAITTVGGVVNSAAPTLETLKTATDHLAKTKTILNSFNESAVWLMSNLHIICYVIGLVLLFKGGFLIYRAVRGNKVRALDEHKIGRLKNA